MLNLHLKNPPDTINNESTLKKPVLFIETVDVSGHVRRISLSDYFLRDVLSSARSSSADTGSIFMKFEI